MNKVHQAEEKKGDATKAQQSRILPGNQEMKGRKALSRHAVVIAQTQLGKKSTAQSY